MGMRELYKLFCIIIFEKIISCVSKNTSKNLGTMTVIARQTFDSFGSVFQWSSQEEVILDHIPHAEY